MSCIYQQNSLSRTGCNSVLQTSDSATVPKCTVRVTKVSFSVKMIWHAYMQLLQFPETRWPLLSWDLAGFLTRSSLALKSYERLLNTAELLPVASLWQHISRSTLLWCSGWGRSHSGVASNSTRLLNSQILFLRQHAGLLFLHHIPGTRKQAVIHSPTLATIKLPLSHQLSVQQLSLGDIIYHSLLGGNAGFRHSPFHPLFCIPFFSYTVLSVLAQLTMRLSHKSDHGTDPGWKWSAQLSVPQYTLKIYCVSLSAQAGHCAKNLLLPKLSFQCFWTTTSDLICWQNILELQFKL